MHFIFFLQFFLLSNFAILAHSWSASTSFISPPLTEICGKCRIRVGNRTTELFSFDDGPKKRFLFVCPRTRQLKMLNGIVLERKRGSQGDWQGGSLQNQSANSSAPKQVKICRIVRWRKYPACNLHKVRPIPRADLHRAKYGRARTNIAQMGFVAKQPELWPKMHPNAHKWFWYFALRLNSTNCRLAKLPTGAPHIILDLGVRLVQMAQPLFICPLLGATNEGPEFFGCHEPHIFMLGDLPLELGFSYDFLTPKGASEFRVNPLEREYSEKGKNVRILLDQQFAGKHSFMEFAPYCDYQRSFAQIQAFNPKLENEEQNEGKMSSSFDALSELQKGLLTIKLGFKSAKNALEKAKQAMGG